MEPEVKEENVENATEKPKKKLNKEQKLCIILAAVLVAFALGVGIYFIVQRVIALKNDTPIEEVLTVENYNKITNGMTYEQVFAILGDGRRTVNTEEQTISYVWEANSSKYIVVNFSATKNAKNELVPVAVTSKAELGVLPTTA